MQTRRHWHLSSLIGSLASGQCPPPGRWISGGGKLRFAEVTEEEILQIFTNLECVVNILTEFVCANAL